MQVIDKFAIKNASHRQIYYKKCKASRNLLETMQVIDVFNIEKQTDRSNYKEKKRRDQ